MDGRKPYYVLEETSAGSAERIYEPASSSVDAAKFSVGLLLCDSESDAIYA
jgi:hypothetical protein